MTQDRELAHVRTDVHGFINRYVDLPADFGDDQPIISAGLLDSIVVIQLIDYLQRTYNLVVDDVDLELENFDSIDGIHSFVCRKLDRP